MKAQLESIPETSNLRRKAQELQENVRDTAQNAARPTSEYVEENPWKAIAIVAVCALAVGFFLRSAND